VHRNDVVDVTLSDADLQVSQDAGAYGNPQLYGSGVTPSLRRVAHFRYGRHPQVARIRRRSRHIAASKSRSRPEPPDINCNVYDPNCLADNNAVHWRSSAIKVLRRRLTDTVRVTDVQILPKEEWKSHLGKLLI